VDASSGHGFHLVAAVPWPPEMMAPAWPMRRPGGAVCPAMKRLPVFHVLLDELGAASSAEPPISPIMTMASVSGSSLSRRSASMCVVPMMDRPPMPMAVGWADAALGQLVHGLISEGAGAGDYPDRLLVMLPGMNAIVGFAGEMTPGQLGPTRRDADS